MNFNTDKFVETLRIKRLEKQVVAQKVIGFRKIAIDTGLSLATVHRAATGKKSDIDTILALCTWMNVPINNFIES
jgi:DNA-binding Xre family transcriptional regulator